ncbi:hypothetical protein GCK72_021368 [Caenorhabditis remanei]|uniref:F-box domain-containing protein n=1 Tax=Caenorhabditis remanei TaxID=31234 RepID=A0A6A5GJ85_CAERE|nr:hypothetical protein GCK72_021368 [Caenorhabditis remanei]KAF1754804.1 hypothetical protein GCK72_021368 [Caenorhabditis remanei]
MAPSFLEIPDLPMEIIMNYLDYIAIQSVRKTCWDLRNFIDDKTLGICLKRIESPLYKLFQNFLQFHEYDKDLFAINAISENLFIDAFGEAFETPEEIEENRFFNVPGNKEKVLKVYYRYVLFEFQFVEKCEVPEGYVILD